MIVRCCSLLLCVLFLTACKKEHDRETADAFPVEAIRQGVQLMQTHCHVCHGIEQRSMDAMLAPPLWGVRAHYLQQYPEPAAFVTAVTDFVTEPEQHKSLMPLELDRYGLKAPVSLEELEIQRIAMAIYSGQVERPEWSRAYEKLHRDCAAQW